MDINNPDMQRILQLIELDPDMQKAFIELVEKDPVIMELYKKKYPPALDNFWGALQEHWVNYE